MAVFVSASVIPNSYPPVIPVDPVPVITPVIVTIWPANRGVNPSVVVPVRCIIGISYRMIISSVRPGKYLAKSNSGPDKEPVIWPVDIKSVETIDIACIVVKVTQIVVIDPETANAPDHSVPIPNIDIANLTYPSVKVIEYRYVLYLDHCTVIVILHKWVIVEPGVEGNAAIAHIHLGSNGYPVIDIEVKFSIRIYRKSNPVFHKNERLAVIVITHRTAFPDFSLHVGNTQQDNCEVID